jgi:broad specificity phosphatase PhoE
MFVAEVLAEHDADGGDTNEKDEQGEQVIRVDFSDLEEHVTDDEVDERPKDVDGRRGESFAGRFGEGRGKGITADSLDEVGDEVGKEHSGEETGNVVIPGHKTPSEQEYRKTGKCERETVSKKLLAKDY